MTGRTADPRLVEAHRALTGVQLCHLLRTGTFPLWLLCVLDYGADPKATYDVIANVAIPIWRRQAEETARG
ncbi:MAG: hypothetical protein NUW01_12975 [Gemmatimonadaceae bacterium]|nr:hypothetical protein [Gemmatimonadaceae bacterium]